MGLIDSSCLYISYINKKKIIFKMQILYANKKKTINTFNKAQEVLGARSSTERFWFHGEGLNQDLDDRQQPRELRRIQLASYLRLHSDIHTHLCRGSAESLDMNAYIKRLDKVPTDSGRCIG